MKTVGDVCDLLETFAPLSLQESYDNAGLILGRRGQEVSGVLIALDLTLDVIREAAEKGFNLIVTHHPFIFKGLKTISGKNNTERCLIEAIRQDLAIYAGHTNVDSVINGVSGRMAKLLGLSDRRILVPGNNAIPESGLGIIGQLPEELNESEFLQLTGETFGSLRLRHSCLTGRKIRKVALCGGAGSEFLTQAMEAGADAFVTGEAKYHEFFMNASDILLVDAGHYETEQFTKDIFFELISKKLPKFAVQISEVETNPVHYM